MPDLEFVGGKQTTALTEGLASNFEGPLRPQKWHGPYAGAAISNAKRAILGRYLELGTMENSVDEALDLESAMNALRDISSGKTNARRVKALMAAMETTQK